VWTSGGEYVNIFFLNPIAYCFLFKAKDLCQPPRTYCILTFSSKYVYFIFLTPFLKLEDEHTQKYNFNCYFIKDGVVDAPLGNKSCLRHETMADFFIMKFEFFIRQRCALFKAMIPLV
jgi:hypothetical protein